MHRPVHVLTMSLASGLVAALVSGLVPGPAVPGLASNAAAAAAPTEALTDAPGKGRADARAARLDCDRGDSSFKVVSKRVDRVEPSGSVGVYADVKNVSRQWRSDVRGQVCFYNARGRLIENGLVYATQLAVAPRQRIGFYISEHVAPSWSHYTLRFQSRRTRLRPVTDGVTVTTGEVATDADGRLEVPVSVRNDNPFTISGVNVYVTLFDARDRIISVDLTRFKYTDPSRLAPGDTGTFTAIAFADFAGLHHLRVSVEAFRAR